MGGQKRGTSWAPQVAAIGRPSRPARQAFSRLARSQLANPHLRLHNFEIIPAPGPLLSHGASSAQPAREKEKPPGHGGFRAPQAGVGGDKGVPRAVNQPTTCTLVPGDGIRSKPARRRCRRLRKREPGLTVPAATCPEPPHIIPRPALTTTASGQPSGLPSAVDMRFVVQNDIQQ
jgi:hypothetical protein